jgi:DNA polymerase-3 subunit alpha
VEDAKEHGVKVALPNINRISSKFIVDGELVRFGMSAIKNVGETLIERIKEEHGVNGEYTSFENFVTRTKKEGMNKKALEALILSGSLDSIHGNRRQKYESMEKVLNYAGKIMKEDDIQQMNLFGAARATIEKFQMPSVDEYKMENLLKGEKEFLGFYFTGHPLDKYKELLKVYRLKSIGDVKGDVSLHVGTYGMVRNLKKVITKKTGQVMGVFDLEDYYGRIGAVVFPRDYERMGHYLLDGEALYVEGVVQTDHFGGHEEKKIIIRDLRPLDEITEIKKFKVYILINEDDKSKMPDLKNVISRHTGDARVYLALKEGSEKRVVELDKKYRVSPSKSFIRDVVELLGKDKIAIK